VRWREVDKKQLFRELKQEWKDDKLTDTSGSLVFFGVLSLFPFLLFLVTLAGLVMTPQNVEAVVLQLGKVAPKDVTNILEAQIREIHQGRSVGLLTFGFLLSIWSASGGVVSLMTALNKVYDVDESRPFWKVRLTAIAVTLGAGGAALVAALVGVAAGPIAAHLPAPLSSWVFWLRLPVAGLIMMFVWACLYYFLPDVEQQFRFISPGSVIGVILWLIASWGFGFYASRFAAYNKTYGAIGGVIVLLTWMFISALVLLLGAELNATIEHLSPEGKRAGAKSMADQGADKAHLSHAEPAAPPAPPRPEPRQPMVPALMVLLLTRLFGRRA
jgi:membrane protein